MSKVNSWIDCDTRTEATIDNVKHIIAIKNKTRRTETKSAQILALLIKNEKANGALGKPVSSTWISSWGWWEETGRLKKNSYVVRKRSWTDSKRKTPDSVFFGFEDFLLFFQIVLDSKCKSFGDFWIFFYFKMLDGRSWSWESLWESSDSCSKVQSAILRCKNSSPLRY